MTDKMRAKKASEGKERKMCDRFAEHNLRPREMTMPNPKGWTDGRILFRGCHTLFSKSAESTNSMTDECEQKPVATRVEDARPMQYQDSPLGR
jgi:hypothetical protein